MTLPDNRTINENAETDPRWLAVTRRDPRADGRFVYAVTTTGIYCRPTCPSRRPKPVNARFFSAPEIAEQAGFRPCRRCKPNALAGEHSRIDWVAAACRQIEAAEQPLSLAQLAAHAGLSRYHFQRAFKKALGLTPYAYTNACRQRRLQEQLQTAGTVTDALYEAGFATSSRMYAQAPEMLGMSPSRYRAGASGLEIHYAIARCSLGWVMAATTERGVCAIHLGSTQSALRDELNSRFGNATLQEDQHELATILAVIVAYIETPSASLDLPVDIQGTAFQRKVWQSLRAVPAGSTISYADLARAIGQPGAARAVAGACANNRLAIAIPCHRVIKSDGSLSGYRWGTERKQALLDREAGARNTSRTATPDKP